MSETIKQSKTVTRLAALGAASLVVLIMGLIPLHNWSAWHDLFIGRLIQTFGAVPAANHTMYSIPEMAPSVTHAWFGQWVMFKAFQVMDLEAVLWLRNHMYALGFGLGGFAISKMARSPWLKIATVLAGFASCMMWAIAGPQMLAAPLWAMVLLLVSWCAVKTRSGKQYISVAIALGLLTTLWANLDVSFGLVFLAIVWGAFKARRANHGLKPWLGFGIVCLVAPLINPRGFALIPHTVDVLLTMLNHPASLTWGVLLPTNGVAGILFWSIVGIVATLLVMDQEKDKTDIALFVVMVVLGASHARASIWFGLALPFFMAGALSRLKPDEKTRAVGWGKIVLILLLANVVPALTQPIFVTHQALTSAISPMNMRMVQPHKTTIMSEVPIEAVLMIQKQMSQSARIYAPNYVSGYLLFELQGKAPYPMVHADDRLTLQSKKHWALIKKIENGDANWDKQFKTWQIDFALLHQAKQKKLIDAIKQHKSWRVAYESKEWIYVSRK